MTSLAHRIFTIETPDLGDRTYVIAIGDRAAVVDPQRDIDRVIAILDEHGLDLELVLETHIHNDYLTGGFALARTTGATYVVSADDDVAYSRHPVGAGDRLDLGTATMSVLPTPGHTPTHLSYALELNGLPTAVFTGGSLLFGTVGRTDLISPEMTESLTRQQYRSVMGLLRDLDTPVDVYPTHGFGSFCASGGSSGASASTIGLERTSNLTATSPDEDAFVETVISGLGPYPAYYRNMAPNNLQGPTAVTLPKLPPLTAGQIEQRTAEGEWVIDLRQRERFAASHVSGTYSFEHGDSMATYLGWVMPWGTPLAVIAESEQTLDSARTMLARIGIEAGAAAVVDNAAELSSNGMDSYPVRHWDDVAALSSNDAVLVDTRQPDEFADGHLAGAINVPFYELPTSLEELPDGELWVYCRSGYRAAVSASMLDAAGRSVVLIDDQFDQAKEHLTIVE